MGQSSAVTDPSASRPPVDRPPLDLTALDPTALDPTSLDPTGLDPSGAGGVSGFTVEVVEEAASTNALAAERARAADSGDWVVVAEHQTAGRGRLDRTWETPARAALTCSLLVRPAREPAAWPWVPLLAGVATAEAIREAGLPAELKWPNDVLVDGRKVAGILVERVDTPSGSAAVVGIGINVSTRVEELPAPLPGAAVPGSLALAGAQVDRTALLRGLLARFRDEYDAWHAPGGQANLRASYTALCVTAHDQPVQVDRPAGDVVTGVGRGITEDGALLVDTESGPVTVSAGDVIHVRAT
jgi:BirA family biotin operon repressor/biotin-[acetyl-CoA-carboxylase] ligase